jgi:AraC-like DNA-binding protein
MRATKNGKAGPDGAVVRPGRTATVLTWVLPHLLAHVAACGHDATPLRLLPGLRGRDLDDPVTRVADTAAVEAWRLAEQVTGDDALGLHMAQAIPAGALDLLEYAFRSSPTLDIAVKQLVRYGRAVGERTPPALFVKGDKLSVSWGGLKQRQRTEFAVSILIRLARDATGTTLAPLDVCFAHKPPENLFEHRAFFRAPLQYESPSNQLLFARSDFARPLRSADPALSGVVCRRLEKMLTQVPARDDSTAVHVRRLLLENLARGEPNAAATARELGLSERTLHRRLRAERTSFRKILDTVRGDLATDLLSERRIGIAEIAFVLGYSEPAAFYRSFRRWTGQTPLAFRRASRTA